jgi:hypothetical protein
MFVPNLTELFLYLIFSNSGDRHNHIISTTVTIAIGIKVVFKRVISVIDYL